jgi:hypothetical protein
MAGKSILGACSAKMPYHIAESNQLIYLNIYQSSSSYKNLHQGLQNEEIEEQRTA